LATIVPPSPKYRLEIATPTNPKIIIKINPNKNLKNDLVKTDSIMSSLYHRIRKIHHHTWDKKPRAHFWVRRGCGGAFFYFKKLKKAFIVLNFPFS
jgi:hypothetical protein